MRLLLVGAFPYPHHQGSQVYFQEQAIALRAERAEISLVTYAAGTSPVNEFVETAAGGGERNAEYWRALDGFDHHTSKKWSSPASLRSGPNWTKPLSDLGLAITLREAVASRHSNDAFDAILTHNAEATLIALHSLPRARPAIVYCAHTLLGNELSAYSNQPKNRDFSSISNNLSARGALAWSLDRLGDRIDRWIAERVDGWLALTQSSERVMRQYSKAPGALVAPPVPDPERALEPLRPSEVARRHRLVPGQFFLYSGNLDRYQELDILAAAAAELAKRYDSPPAIVIACHAAVDAGGHDRRWPPGRGGGADADSHGRQHQMRKSPLDARTAAWAASIPGVQFLRVESASEMHALLAAARASLVMRRVQGGFPIKLVNSLALGTPAIAFHEQEWGLTHERNSLICAAEQPARGLADAIERLSGDDALARRLAVGARALYVERHLPELIAPQTLALLEKVSETCLFR